MIPIIKFNERNYILYSFTFLVYIILHSIYLMFGPVCQYLESVAEPICVLNSGLNLILLILGVAWIIFTLIMGIKEIIKINKKRKK
jgi:hypothetical protein